MTSEPNADMNAHIAAKVANSDLFKDFSHLRGAAQALLELGWGNATPLQRVNVRYGVISLLEAASVIDTLLRERQEDQAAIRALRDVIATQEQQMRDLRNSMVQPVAVPEEPIVAPEEPEQPAKVFGLSVEEAAAAFEDLPDDRPVMQSKRSLALDEA